MPSYIGLLIHVPKLTKEYQDNVFLQMRALLDVCEKNLPLEEEVWHLVKDRSTESTTYKFAADELLLWHVKAGDMQDRCCSVGVNVCFAMKSAQFKHIRIHATITHSEKWTTPKIKEECTITGVIHRQVWDKIDQPKLIETIQNACLILGATYACIDYEYFCPKSIYYGGFRFYGKEVPRYFPFPPGYIDPQHFPYPDIDPEAHLPGVYWAQFVSQRMLEATGTLQVIESDAPCDAKKVIGGKGVEGMWLQLSPNLWKTPVEKRLLLRRYVSDSLYELDMHRLADAKTPHSLGTIHLLPLEDEETQDVERLRKQIAMKKQGNS